MTSSTSEDAPAPCPAPEQTPRQADPHAPTSPTTPMTGRPAVITALALSAGTAVLVGSEFAPAGVLPGMAADLGVSEGRAGLSVAVTALAGAITAPTIASILPRADRRTVLLSLLALAMVSNVIAALAPTLGILLIARILLGAALAGFWSFTFAVGVHVTGRPALVSTTVALGTSSATVLGVPMSSILGDLIGWRAVFLVFVGLTIGAAAILWRLLPPVPAQPGAGLTMMRAALANRRLVLGVSVVGVAALANFTAYPYIRLAIEGVDAGAVALLLLIWGIGGLVGNIIGGYASRSLRWSLAGALLLLGLSLAVISSTEQIGILTLGIIGWGVSFAMVPVLGQLWVSTVEPGRVESAVALHVTAFQIAIMVGAVVGGLLVDHQGYGAAMAAGAVAAVLAAVGFAAIKVLPRAD